MLLFFLTALSHAAFLAWGKKNQVLRLDSQEKIWRIHFIFNGILWVINLAGAVWEQFSPPDISYTGAIRVGGLVFIILGAWLVAKSGKALGIKRTMGFNIFFPEKTEWLRSGIYKFLNNPMYDGFILLFAGLGFALGITENFIYAAETFLLLNIFMASIENQKFKLDPF